MTARTVDPTGLIWQESRHGPKIVGEVHRTRSGRYFVVIAGRRIATGLPTFAGAVHEAETYEPDPADAAILARILDPTA